MAGGLTKEERIERNKLQEKKLKKCGRCREIKSWNDFHKDSRPSVGLQGLCKKCHRNHQIKYSKTERGKEVFKKASRKVKAERPHRTWAISTLSMHRRQGYITQITNDELEIIARKTICCKICDCELNWVYGTKNRTIQNNSPSLDRINNGKIINSNNIQILCMKCNTTKRDRSMKQMLEYCEKFVKKFKGVL